MNKIKMGNVYKRAGAPKGGRVHWLALMIPRIIKQNYNYEFKYEQHNYYLNNKATDKSRYDEYIIIRTSEKCYRVSYFDKPTKTFEYNAFRKAEDVIDYLLYRLPKKMQQEKDYAAECEARRRAWLKSRAIKKRLEQELK